MLWPIEKNCNEIDLRRNISFKNNKNYKHVSIANSIQLCVHKTKRNMFRFSPDLVLRILSFSFFFRRDPSVSFLIIHRLATTMNPNEMKWNETRMEKRITKSSKLLWYLCDEWWTIKSNWSWIYSTILFNLLPFAFLHKFLYNFGGLVKSFNSGTLQFWLMKRFDCDYSHLRLRLFWRLSRFYSLYIILLFIHLMLNRNQH